MSVMNSFRLIGTAAVFVAIPLLSATSQTQSPSLPGPPAQMKPETTAPPAERQTMPPTAPSDRMAAAPSKVDPLVGLAVLSSDGSKLGNVRSVKSGPDGTTTAILLKTGGFLGFGGHVVAIPANKFTRSGDSVHVSMTAEEVSKLPEAKEQG